MRSKAAQQMYRIYLTTMAGTITIFVYAALNLIPWVHEHVLHLITWIGMACLASCIIMVCIFFARFWVFYRRGL
ncbi:hypothetical protein SAMN05421799_10415 [Alicyclobacillus vulcanalis]|uniref:Uncharacterized protein n=1 Tax=Alicyclobacillus vulcanalis TaxID=252246 RepID=A0A1N7LVS9_9BACL|nr:hypothetical protein SAMN05421799_10415 [Alicyclobacillus vulcanalis]